MTSSWRLRKGMDRRVRSGHPWVYSNELAESPKGLVPGSTVRLEDAGGKFLAYGIGNPHSLISFRAVSRRPEDDFQPGWLLKRLQQAQSLRIRLGYSNTSYRLCFGESDGLPGLVIDRYATEASDVLVVQAHTAGADLWVKSGEVQEALETLYSKSITIVLRNDVSVRKLEGLAEEPSEVLKGSTSLEDVGIWIKGAGSREKLLFRTDLKAGQKTGFFLDQGFNVSTTARILGAGKRTPQLRILDLCCYVGQWGTQLGAVLKQAGSAVHVTAVDASDRALKFAHANMKAQGLDCETQKLDVLKGLSDWKPEFDLVIMDPPGLIKSRKDIPTGTHAYLQLMTQSFRLLKPEGLIVACSCSALLTEESFAASLAKAAMRNGREPKWIARGSQSPDHPVLAEFPEGRYLKSWIGYVS